MPVSTPTVPPRSRLAVDMTTRSAVPGNTSRISRVPSVPVLFDDEPQNSDADAADPADNDHPEIILEPLHVLDPLCIKWKLGNLSTPTDVPEAPLRKAEPEPAAAPAPQPQHQQPEPMPMRQSPPISSIPPSGGMSGGYLRLLGLLFNGTPWECSIPLADMARPGGITIGRDPAYCNILLAEGSISRQHVCLELMPNGVVISDQNSTNGTFVNGRRLESYERRVPIMDGYIIGLGDITLRVEILSPSPAYMPV